MSDDADDPRQIDKPANAWADCERVVPWHTSPLPDRDALWEMHKQRNLIRREPKPPQPPRGIRRRVF
ncbi:MAG: hypothetical protein EKK29_13780 [Hyphomicrobiales bacterium]|nr:MAG: hypothetical protein EKK29_13780 [Hyphomicrobiales bacterium]